MIHINRLGKVIFYNNTNLYHRLDGPAIIGNYKEWWLNGKKHRLDGPAVINGEYQAWWENGIRHRINGPAYINGEKIWYIENEKVSESEYNEKLKEIEHM